MLRCIYAVMPRKSAERQGRRVQALSGSPDRQLLPGGATRRCGANYLYRVLPQLQREGKITKEGKGYHAAGDTGAVAHTSNGQGVSA